MIDLRNVSKTYQGKQNPVAALSNVTMSIAAGEFVAVVGASGSGKSTLLQIIGCLDVPTSGHYAFDGEAVEKLDDAALSHIRNERIGFVFQNFNLIPRTTALENVETPLLYARESLAGDRARAALNDVGMSHRADHFTGEMSGGEQQRVAIARALVMRPSLLIADEPTGNLDSATGRQILDLLRELHGRGLTIVLVTHDPTVARLASRVVKLEDGRVQLAKASSPLAGGVA